MLDGAVSTGCNFLAAGGGGCGGGGVTSSRSAASVVIFFRSTPDRDPEHFVPEI